MFTTPIGYTPGASYNVNSSAIAAGLAANKLIVNRVHMKVARIMVQVYPIRVTNGGATPVAAGLGDLVEVGGEIFLESPAECDDFRYITEESGNHATLVVHPGY